MLSKTAANAMFRPDFMQSVHSNDIDGIKKADLSKVKLSEFENALNILRNNNIGWEILPSTNMTKAVITGLSNHLSKLQEAAKEQQNTAQC